MNKLQIIIKSYIPFLKGKNKQVVKDEIKSGLAGKEYSDFKEFLQDCPEYQIKSGWMATQIRNIFRSFGAKYQQYVFIDKSSPEDKTVFLRVDGDLLIHGKGTYARPWDSEKKIIYFDIHDMRPLIDNTNEMDWKNPDAVADVVTAITNARGMANMGNKSNDQMILIIAILAAIGIILTVVGIYTQIENTKTIVTAISNINLSSVIS